MLNPLGLSGEPMLFPLPPYEEQKRIVNAINKAFTNLDTIAENL